MPPARTIVMTGLGARTPEELVGTLARAGTAVVVDVRRYPGSGRHAGHAAADLHGRLRAAGMEVRDLGALLGGDRPGGYPRWMRGGGFAKGLAALEALASRAPATVVCAERDHRRCHRRFLAAALEARGWTVRHLDAAPARPAARAHLRLVQERS